ncbi:MAG: biotin/lipoyl-binding protein, partial [Bacteroidales bacterium]|nr:biotin/lipoyl-binding protein [Bacteroidales bacterium]
MDKQLEKVTGWKVALTKKALPYWGGAALAILIGWLLIRDNASTLNVDRDSVSVAEVKNGEFNDYIRVSGQVEPLVTIQISPIEGGVVKEILIEEGSDVHKGDEILRLSNDNVELEILNCEAELAEKENILRNTQIQMEQDRLNVRQTRAEFQVNVRRLKRTYEQQKTLYEEKLIAREDYLKAKEDYELALEKLELIREKEVQDSM